MARKKQRKLIWEQIAGTKTETWICVTKEGISATVIKKGDDYIYNVSSSDNKPIASGWTKGYITATGNAELRIRSALLEDLG
jgi:hypothetical protein